MVGKDEKHSLITSLEQNIGKISIFFSVFVIAYNCFISQNSCKNTCVVGLWQVWIIQFS